MKIFNVKTGGDWWPLAEGEMPAGQFVAGKTFQQCQEDTAPDNASVYQNSWISQEDWQQLSAAGVGAKLLNEEGETLAWLDAGDGTIVTSGGDSLRLLYPWDLLQVNEQLVGALSENVHIGVVSPAAHIDGFIHVGAGSRILPGVVIEGNAVIGENCKIGPNCYIRGNTAIGDGVHIGQAVEVKNSIIGNGSSVGHLSYVGDSVIGNKVNFGAATVTSNLRHDGKNHRTSVAGSLIDTGRRKLGTIVGDHVHTGIHTAIYPGRKLGPNSTTRPNESVDKDIV